MAEIKIKRKRPIWPWVLTLLVLLGFIIYFGAQDDYVNDEDIENVGPGGVGIGPVPPPVINRDKERDSMNSKSQPEVAEYLFLIGDTSKLGSDTNYTRKVLMHLIAAVERTAEMHDVSIDAININTEFGEGKNQVVTKASDPTKLVQEIKGVGMGISKEITAIQEKKFPDLANRTEKIRRTLGDIVLAIEMSEQKERVIAFFKSCGDALRQMQPKNE